MSYVNHRVNKYMLGEEKKRERERDKELIRMKWSYRWASLTAATYYRIRAPIECVRAATTTARDSRVGPAVAVISPR